MPFWNPGMLWWGAGAATVPIIIHLLNRRRFKILDWAAMRFLLESVRKNRRRVRLEELILLALRCLAVMLLAIAAARFTGCGQAGALPGGTPAEMTQVFILDDSVSMGQKLAGTTVFGKATSDLADMLARVKRGSRVAVLLTSQPDRPLFALGSLSNPAELAGTIRALKPSDTTVQLHLAVKEAVDRLSESGRRRVVIFSDFRRIDFDAASELEKLRNSLRSLTSGGGELALMSYGAQPAGNLTVQRIDVMPLEEVEAASKVTLCSVSTRAQVTVRNNGSARSENAPVEFYTRGLDGGELKLPVQTVPALDPAQELTIGAECTFVDPGSMVVEARLPSDGLDGDNIARLAVEVRDARRVLVVDGEYDVSDPSKGDSYFLSIALDPKGDHRSGNNVEVVPTDHLAEINFERYDAVVLANVSEFPMGMIDNRAGYPQLEALARYVNKGGGLAIFVGGRVNPAFYNGAFLDSGLCPAKLGAPVGDARTRQSFFRLLRESISNEAVLRSFQGKRAQFTQMVRFYSILPAEVAGGASTTKSAGPVRVLAQFDNAGGTNPHAPAVLARPFGHGQVMLVCSTADKDWNDWPKDYTYVTFVNDLVATLSRPSGQFTGLVGERIEYVGGAELASGRATLRTPLFPAEEAVPLESRPLGAQRQITYENPRSAGVYELELSGGDESRKVQFARNVDPQEGRLEVATEAELAGKLGVKFAYEDRISPGALTGQAADRGQEYWKAALAAMLIVLALEVFLGQRFGHYQS